MLPVLLVAAAGAWATMTPPADRPEGAPAAPKATQKELWDRLYGMVDKFNASGKPAGPVMVYDLETDARLPSRIFIVAEPRYKGMVGGLLTALYGEGWEASNKFWVVDVQEAVRGFSKAMKAKGDPAKVREIRKKILDELGPCLFLVYRVRPIPSDEEEAPKEQVRGEPRLDPTELSSATVPVSPR